MARIGSPATQSVIPAAASDLRSARPVTSNAWPRMRPPAVRASFGLQPLAAAAAESDVAGMAGRHAINHRDVNRRTRVTK